MNYPVRYRAILAGLAVAATALAGCSGHREPGTPGSVDVTGAFGAPVTISVSGNLHVDGVRHDVLIPGDGVEPVSYTHLTLPTSDLV